MSSSPLQEQPLRTPPDPAVFDPSQSFFPRALLQSDAVIAEAPPAPRARGHARKLLAAALLSAGAALGYSLWQNVSEVRPPAADAAPSVAAESTAPAATAAPMAPRADAAASMADAPRTPAAAPKTGVSAGPITPAAVRPRRASPPEEPPGASRPSVTHTKSAGYAAGVGSASEVEARVPEPPPRPASRSADPRGVQRGACREELAALGLCKPAVEKEGN
jgi:hypothetical protein